MFNIVFSVAGSATVAVSRRGRGKSVTSASGANLQMQRDSGVYVCLSVNVCVCMCVRICICMYLHTCICVYVTSVLDCY